MTRYDQAVRHARSDLVGAAVHVFDLDGVVRDFGAEPVVSSLEAELGLAPGAWAATAFQPDSLRRVTTGRITFAQWSAEIGDGLEGQGADPAAVPAAVQRWAAYRGTPVRPTLDWIEQLRGEGAPVYLFTNGTDAIPAELAKIGLSELIPVVINSAILGVAKPDRDAYAAAHRHIESSLGRTIDPGDVGFIDDRVANVEGARDFGWRATHFDPSAGAG